MSRNNSPVFVVGCSRSGTTMLQGMLLSIDGLDTVFETEVMFRLWRPRHLSLEGLRERARQLVSERVVDVRGGEALQTASSREDLIRVTLDVIRQSLGCRRLVEKTPRHFKFVEELLMLYPEGRIIFIFRDPRDVAPSFRDTLGTPMLIGLVQWKRAMKTMRTAEAWKDPRILSVRYEDLVRVPEVAMKQLARFLGEEEPAVIRVEQKMFPESHLREGGEKVIRSAVGRYRQRLSKSLIGACELVAGPQLRSAGYAPEVCTGGLAGRLSALIGLIRLSPAAALFCLRLLFRREKN